VIGRAAPRPTFDHATLADLRAIRPLFEAALGLSERARIVEAVAQSCTGATVAFLRDGRVAWMSSEARRVLRGMVPPELREAALGDHAVVPLRGADALEAQLTSSPRLVVAQIVRAPAASWVCRLPRRLRRVLDLLATGASEKEIADRAGLSYASAHQYVVQIYRRAGVSSRAQLMAQLGANATDRRVVARRGSLRSRA
jgi:DNA-binding NarL/FixJ family response regulator